MDRFAYPRTYHLPWSPGATSDDKFMKSIQNFIGQRVIVTEKRDGENTTLYPDGYVHARSIDGTGKEYQSWIIRKWREVSFQLDEDLRVGGENLFARHSVAYENLESYFEAFGVYSPTHALSWDESQMLVELLGLKMVPVLFDGIWDERVVRELCERVVAEGGEGIVVRIAAEFPIEEFHLNVGKYVRENHVQTDQHWTKTWVPNGLKG